LEIAKRLGACGDRLCQYKVGQPIAEVAADDLAWIERREPQLAREAVATLCAALGVNARAVLPLSLFGSGYGYGYGSGYGDGYGYGYGYSDGDGYGFTT
jgi:hypothetical protein